MTVSVEENSHSPVLVSNVPPEHMSGPDTGGTHAYSIMQFGFETVKVVN